MKKIVRMVMSVMTAALAATGSGQRSGEGLGKAAQGYMFKEVSSENLVKIYEALGREAAGQGRRPSFRRASPATIIT